MSLERFSSDQRVLENEVWQLFIPQNSNLTIEWGGREKQEQWGKLFLLALQRCDAWLANEAEVKSLQDIYYFIAYERIKIARILGHNLTYGMPRFSNSIQSPFSPKRLRTKTQYTYIKEKFLAMPKNDAGEVEYKILLNAKEKIILTLSFDQENEVLYVNYPSVKIAKKLMQEANKIFLDLLNHKNEFLIKDKYYQLGKILWYLAIARPLEFGSASVAEALYYTLAKQIGIPLVALNFDNKTWDIWAMYHADPDEFARWFSETAMHAFSTHPHFTLPPLAMIDHTTAIENEVKLIFEQAKENDDPYYDNEMQEIAPYQTTQLVDPYGLGLFHHFHLFIFKIEFEKARHLIETTSSPSYEKSMDLPYQIMSNGQILFFDALLNVPNNIDPVLFKINMMKNIQFYEFKNLQNQTDKSIILDKIQYDINLYYYSAPNEIKRKVLLSYFSYFMSVFDNPEIKRLAKYARDIIQTIPSSNNFFEEIRLKLSHNDHKRMSRLFELFKLETIYTDAQLIKLIEITGCDGIEIYFKSLSIQDWLSPRIHGKSFFDKVLETSNAQLMTCLLNVLTDDHIETVINYVADKNDHPKLTFLFFHLINVMPLSKISTKVKSWLDQHPDVNLLSLVLDNENPLTKPFSDLLPVLFQGISPVKLKQVPIDNVLRIMNRNNKIAAVDFFANSGIDLTLPPVIDQELMNHLQYYIYFSENIDVCRQLCRQLNPKTIKNMVTINENYFYFSSAHNNSIINFCKILNELAGSAKEYSPLLFSYASTKEDFQQAVIKGIFTYINHSYDINFNILKLYFIHLDFLTKEHLQICKDILCKNSWRVKDESVIAVLDERIKTLSQPALKN